MKIRIAIMAGAACGWLTLTGCGKAADQPGATAPSAKPAAADKTTVASALEGLKSADEATKLKAISFVSVNKVAEAVDPLVALFKDPSAEVRAEAASALGDIGAPAKKAVESLVELLKDESPVVRREALQSIFEIKPGPQVTVPLCVKLLENSTPGMQVRVLNAITEAGPQAVPGLIEALKNDNGAYWAAIVIRELGPVAKDAIPGLVSRLTDPRPNVRREIVLALAAMGEAAEPAVPQLAALLTDEHCAPAATFALGRAGRVPADVESKIQANAKGSNKLLAATSYWALGNLHPNDKAIRTEVTEQLLALLKDEDGYVRAAAARSLGSLPPAPDIVMPIFEKALTNGDETTIHYALDALAQLGGKAVPRLIEALKYEKLRPQIAYILKQIGPDAAPATDALAVLVIDKNEDTADAAAMALASIGSGAKGAVPALAKALGQPGAPAGYSVAYALGSIGPDAAAAEPALSAVIGGKNEDLAMIAAWALTRVKPTPETAAKVVPMLTKALASDEPVHRRSAAEALGNLGPLAKDAIPALETASKDSDKSVSEAASKALASVKG